MADLGAFNDADLVPRTTRDAAAVVPAWRVVGRCVTLVTAIRGAVAEAAHRPSSPAEFAARAQRTARIILGSHGVAVRGVGPIPQVPCLVVSNHVSYLDALVIASLIPCIAIAKAETSRWPLFGAGLRALGVVFVARSDPASGAVALRTALRVLRNGGSVLNFPEGTTTDGRAVGAFRRGSFGLARLARVPIVPARIVYDDDRVPWFGGQKFGPHYARLARVPLVTTLVRFGEALMPNGSDDAADLAIRARGIIRDLGT
jgi:1-acyl-sn-glycerol-3-phosphate acyltransferase